MQVAPKKKPTPVASHPKELQEFQRHLESLLKGKESLSEVMLCSMLASGHILLEDAPGVGKTTLIKAIAKLLGIEMRRIQCTNDILPSDIIGVEVYNSAKQAFEFHHGPIFSNILFVDELNRASPRTQSALLEAMGEGVVTVDRHTHQLPHPFLVFAAQNPSNNIGTYPLPESQLDRFAIRLSLNYPTSDKEREIFLASARDPIADLPAGVMSAETLESLQAKLESIHIAEAVADYVQRFVEASRTFQGLKQGISTRGGVIWLRLAKARALLLGRDYVTPDDLVVLAPFCLTHRVLGETGSESDWAIRKLLQTIDVEA